METATLVAVACDNGMIQVFLPATYTAILKTSKL
jgi:hypothetical protein